MKRKGSRNRKGVSRILVNGYYDVFEPRHPLARTNGYIREHRMIAYDAGLLTDPSMEVHHVNGIKTDNRLENLQVLTKAEHASITCTGLSRTAKGCKCRDCDTLTRSKYGLCAYHYRKQWDRDNKKAKSITAQTVKP